MDLECAGGISANPVTQMDIERAFDDDKGRGEYIILSQNPDTFMQAAGEGNGPYVLEYRDGEIPAHFQCTMKLVKAQVRDAFIKYFNGDPTWETSYEWEPLSDKPWWKFW